MYSGLPLAIFWKGLKLLTYSSYFLFSVTVLITGGGLTGPPALGVMKITYELTLADRCDTARNIGIEIADKVDLNVSN